MKKTVRDLYLRLLTKRNISWRVIGQNPIELEVHCRLFCVRTSYDLKNDELKWRVHR